VTINYDSRVMGNAASARVFPGCRLASIVSVSTAADRRSAATRVGPGGGPAQPLQGRQGLDCTCTSYSRGPGRSVAGPRRYACACCETGPASPTGRCRNLQLGFSDDCGRGGVRKLVQVVRIETGNAVRAITSEAAKSLRTMATLRVLQPLLSKRVDFGNCLEVAVPMDEEDVVFQR
jgi:hypothetical protein